MKKSHLFLLFLLITPILFFYQYIFFGKVPIPADTIIGLYHPYRDLYAKTFPNGIVFKNFLLTDPVRQQYIWRELSINELKKGQLPLWNPYAAAGTPLLANFQSAALYPFNSILFLLPFVHGWSLLVLLQPVLSGLFLYFYLRFLKIDSFAAVFGAFVFAFCGFQISWLEWNTLGHVALWLPLILLAIEQLLKKISWKWIGILLFAQISQILAGHLQILFYSLLISNLYIVIRIFERAKKTTNQKRSFWKVYSKIYLPFFFIGCGVAAITAIQWLPTMQFILLSARGVDQADWTKPGWFIPWEHLLQFFIPDFFGNPATLNYWGTWNYAEFNGYIGITPLIFSFLAIFFRYDKKTFFFGTVFFLSLLFALPNLLSQIPFHLKIPFLSSAQPTRLLFITDFSLAVLSALGFDYFLKKKKKILPVLGIIACLYLFVFLLLSFGKSFFSESISSNFFVAKRNMVIPVLLFLFGGGICILLLRIHNRRWQKILISLLLLLTCIDLFRFGLKFTSFSSQVYVFPGTKATDFLQSNQENYRMMATSSEIFPPNFSAIYRLQSIDGYDPLYSLRYGELIAASERDVPNIDPPFGFNRIITPHNVDASFIDLLGVKYIMSFTDLPLPRFKKVFQEGKTKIFENTTVSPRAFFVTSIVAVQDKKSAIQEMFRKRNDLQTTAIIEDDKNTYQFVNKRLSVGSITAIRYTANSITVEIENKGDGFLVLTDTYYPTWKVRYRTKDNTVFTNGKIYQTDFNLRGVFIPADTHKIEFYNSLFSL